MSKPGKSWMKLSGLLMSMLLVSSCASGSLEAYCDGTRKTVDELADDLLEDGGPKSTISGAYMISQWDAVC